MNVFLGAARIVVRSAEAAAAAAGAVGGAAVNGVIGGLQGTANGIKNGASSGSHSTPAAVLTLGAIGAAGLVEWPVLLGIGGTALVLRQLNQRTGGAPPTAKPTLSAVPDEPRKRSTTSAASRPASAKTVRTARPAKAAKTTAPRKTTRKTTAATRRAPAKK
jgi:hypothetical protein